MESETTLTVLEYNKNLIEWDLYTISINSFRYLEILFENFISTISKHWVLFYYSEKQHHIKDFW